MFTEATYTHHDTPRARCLALSEANSGDVALKMSGALTTNSHSNELKCMLVERILEKTAQHGFISMSRATERSAHRRRQGAIKVGKKGVFPTHGGPELYGRIRH